MAAKISEKTKYQIRRSGLGTKEIAERFHICARSAATILYGEKTKGQFRPRKMSEEFVRLVGQAEGSTDELAQRFAVCGQTIRRAKAAWRGPDRVTVTVQAPRLRPVFYRPFRDGTYDR